MVESNILGTSPWNSDPFLFKDLNPFPGLDFQGTLDMGFPEHETSESLAFNGETMPSLLNEDFWVNRDELTSPLTSESCSAMTVDSSAADDSLGFESLNWTADTITESSWNSDSSSDVLSNVPSIHTPQNTVRKRNKSPDPLVSGKSWSRMNSEEKLGTVEALTQIISHQMGLRDQLEVINIIDPVAVVNSNDTEFVIDLGCLDDTKLQRIRDYVERHAIQLPPNRRSLNSTNTTPSVSSESSTSSSNGSLDTCNFITNSKPSKKQLREQCKQLKAWHQRQHRQKLKEKRSGLFVREEVVSLNVLSSEPVDDAEDIDILA